MFSSARCILDAFEHRLQIAFTVTDRTSSFESGPQSAREPTSILKLFCSANPGFRANGFNPVGERRNETEVITNMLRATQRTGIKHTVLMVNTRQHSRAKETNCPGACHPDIVGGVTFIVASVIQDFPQSRREQGLLQFAIYG
jgi:hypothetical protein